MIGAPILLYMAIDFSALYVEVISVWGNVMRVICVVPFIAIVEMMYMTGNEEDVLVLIK